MKETGIIPVFYHQDVEICKQVIGACYAGGARVFEFTNRGDMAHEVFREIIVHCRSNYPEMMLGVGSVLDGSTTALYIQLGADFIVSPVMHEDMAKICNRRKIAWMPGCGSVTEISLAHEYGAEVVKIFPGQQVGGPDFVKGVLGPMPWSSIMPTGGVSPTRENLSKWIAAGIHCVGMGSKLITKDIVNSKDFRALETVVKDAIELFRELNG
jgi:2-dehydro-3-deoxyphosphogluconate aldolase/(4S)-4-hydroxy-2-oxoglutarate aldolase